MDTVETRDEPAPSTNIVYDGFISYSHAADDLLAPRLQAGLQRFAKPWWQRRALRIFRDEASLSANPHLWSSITEALDQSDWFVLLLSPEAAESVWVNREVEYWLEHKDRDRIIPVVTDGDFAWATDDIDATSTSAPPALYGAFTDEPRWVDLRFARTEEQLDLNNASFRAAIADIASAIRGVPKDELESEEVRQHRRTRRTAIAAGVALVALTVAASGAAVLAVDRGNEATAQRLAAEDSAAEADSQRQVAEDQTVVAEEQTAVAEALEFDARSDALAGSAIAQLGTDPELALLLGTESLAREPQEVALSATHQALQRHHTLFQIEAAPGNTPFPDGAVGGLSPAGDLLAITTQGPDFAVWDIDGGEPLWSHSFASEDTTIRSVRFTSDGTAVVAVVAWSTRDDPAGANPPPGVPFGLYVFDAATGDEMRSIPIPRCPSKLVPSPLSAYVDLTGPIPWAAVIDDALAADESETARGTCGTFSAAVGLLDPTTGSFTEVTTIATGSTNPFGAPTTDSSGRYFAAGASGPGQVVDRETGALVYPYEGGISTLSADGNLLLAGGHAIGFALELWDLSRGERVWSFPSTFTRVWFSNDERTVYGTSTDGSTYVLDAATGDQILRLRGHAGTPIAATMSHNGRRMATFADDFTARAWDLTPTRSEGATYIIHSQPRVHVGASADLAAGIAAVWGGDVRDEEDLWETTVFDLETEETLARIVGGVPALSPDGSRLAYRVVDRVEVIDGDFRVEGEPGQRPRLGPIRVMDLATKEVLVEIDVPCVEYLMPDEAIPSAECRDPLETAGLEWDLEFSSDGRLLAMADSHDDEMTVWVAATGDIVGSDRQPGANVRAVAFTPDQTQVAFFRSGEVEWSFRVYDLDPFGMVDEIPLDAGITFAEMEFTPDGSLLVAAGSDGDIALFDTSDWKRAAIRAHQGSVLDVAIDPEGTLIASAGGDGFVRVWDLASRSKVTEIEFDVDEMANVEFIDDTHLLVTSGLGSEAIVITLDPLELLAIARERLTRTFTAAECATYVVDPCPTLEEVTTGS